MSLDVLVLAADGSVQKKNDVNLPHFRMLSKRSMVFSGGAAITAQASDTSNNVLVQNRDTDSTIAVYLPVQNGTAGASNHAGFLTYTDWQNTKCCTNHYHWCSSR